MSFILFAVASIFFVAGVIYMAHLSLLVTSAVLGLALIAACGKMLQVVWDTPIWE